MKKIILAVGIILISISSLWAQDKSKPYENGVGGMIGFLNGFTYKGFPLYNFAIQVDAGVSWNWIKGASGKMDGINGKININFMYENMVKPHLYWLIGGGLNTAVGFMPENYYKKGSLMHGYAEYPHRPFIIGANIITGIEYKWPKKNLTFQLDFRPGVFFYTHKENVETRGFTDNYSTKTDFVVGPDVNILNLQLRYTIVKKHKGRSSVKQGGSIKAPGKW